MRFYVASVLLVLQVSLSYATEPAASDGTVAAQPLLTVPAPVNASPQAAPGSHLNEIPNLDGVTSETKNPDGSTTRITHFRGQLPPNAYPPPFPQYNPYFAYSVLPPYFYPVGPPHPGPAYPQPPFGPLPVNPQSLPPPQPASPQALPAGPANPVAASPIK
ncbi:unnamed protein product [Allacma fusca]|uniref:Uncharacterized protein n=1 Tax=Allacma fusca TaxID=39272 RepID=A0A8J2LQL8_9HEXA|nr:unnamed protein product [Allacma fusca]